MQNMGNGVHPRGVVSRIHTYYYLGSHNPCPRTLQIPEPLFVICRSLGNPEDMAHPHPLYRLVSRQFYVRYRAGLSLSGQVWLAVLAVQA